MVMEGSASAFQCHSRRNREYPSFSSALLEEISRSTESYTVEDEKINRRRQEMKFSRDSSIELPVCKEPRGRSRSRGRGEIEIGILEALKYFHAHVDNDGTDSGEVDTKKKKKKKVSALQSRMREPEAESTKRFMGRAAADVPVSWQWQSNGGRRHGSTHSNKDASSLSSSDGVALEQTRTKQPMSPGRRLVNFLNSLLMGMGKRKSKRAHHDHEHPAGKCPSINANWKYKYGEKDKAAAAAGAGGQQFKSVSVCSISSVTSNYTSTASTTSDSNSLRLHHYKSNPCNVSKSNLCNVRKNEHAMKSYDEYTRSPKNGIQRSVRFYPTTTVGLDEYAVPCGKELNRMEIHNKHSLPFPSKHPRRVQLLEKDMIPSEYSIYHQDLKYSNKFVQTKDDEYGDSDSSSDLFELQNLNAMDMDIYSRELPVYETTNLEINRAIARGLL